MKTGTLTFHSPNNNGSFLQAYALQHVLKKGGVDNTIINFFTDRQERQYSVFRKPKSLGELVRNGISVVHYEALEKRFMCFGEQRKKFLDMTERYKTEEDVLDNLYQYDVLICGSDQIWNTGARDFSKIYMLPGVKKKKISYAVSCGSHIKEIELQELISNVRDFDAVSVREKTVAEMLSRNGISDVCVTLDPTLLIKKEEYSCLFKNEPFLDGKYVFVYTINYNDAILSAASRFAKKRRLPVITTFTGYSAIKCRKYGIRVIYDAAPNNFLNLIANAEYVFSNSFHGIAFSILFHKNFFRVCSTDDQGRTVGDDRIDNILEVCNLSDRSIKKTDCIDEKAIDYSAPDKILEKLGNCSVKWLMNALARESSFQGIS